MRIMRAERAVARGVWGHGPPGNFWNFRRSEIDSGTFWDTCTSCQRYMYKLTIRCWYNSRLSHELDGMSRNQSLRVYATRVVCARAKTTPSLNHAHHSAGRAPSLWGRDQGRSIVAIARCG